MNPGWTGGWSHSQHWRGFHRRLAAALFSPSRWWNDSGLWFCVLPLCLFPPAKLRAQLIWSDHRIWTGVNVTHRLRAILTPSYNKPQFHFSSTHSLSPLGQWILYFQGFLSFFFSFYWNSSRCWCCCCWLQEHFCWVIFFQPKLSGQDWFFIYFLFFCNKNDLSCQSKLQHLFLTNVTRLALLWDEDEVHEILKINIVNYNTSVCIRWALIRCLLKRR